MTDILSIMWKEYKEFLHQRGTVRGTVIMMLIPTTILGVLFPMQTGLIWIETPFSLLAWAFVPIMMVVAVIADSFAGERERHTLETLLASRLSDKTILFGKICAAMCYALIITVIVIFLGLITVNISHWDGYFVFYEPDIFVSGLILSVLLACCASCIGIIISLRASTVRQAHQTLTIGLIVIVFTPGIISEFMPSGMKNTIAGMLNLAGFFQVMMMVLGLLIIVNFLLLKLAISRFKRTLLLLD
ncbi:MAG: ABC transporter permease [Candidatus Latescibacteria bacterium]|nr:ABC transporter permease [Candidatus Latescibacterota bacterium]